MDTQEQHNVWIWNYTLVQVEYKVLCNKKSFFENTGEILNLIDDEEIARIFHFCQSAEMDFQC